MTLSARALDAAMQRTLHALPEALDLRDEAALEGLLKAADALVERNDSVAELVAVEAELTANREQWPLGAQVVAKLARSKAYVRARRQPIDVSVVLAVYCENERMLLPSEHPVGEGFIGQKLRQLEWLIDGARGARFDLWIVDDGCPRGSGEQARETLARHHPGAPAHVLFLERAIREAHPIAAPMQSTDESRKGGSIPLGLYEATREGRAGQMALFTDADLSTHLGQTGLLVEALDQPGALLAPASRRDPASVVVKSGARSTRGRLFIYLWKQMLPEIHYVQDTQCGFKAFHGSAVPKLVEQPQIRNFAFDLELLMRAEQLEHGSIRPVPIAWIDSEAASTTTALTPYLSMLQSAAALHRSLRTGGERAEAFARAIDALSEEAFDRAVEQLGPRLEPHDPANDVDARWIDPAEVEALGR